ncbi:putative aldouronate transport system permease protein [Oribacterium sp. KHPX15]|uniref:ABC transporter permease subunit n=1 Tax=Oribacterium sp. KHPX15 TaxID=1855342 RepID=UPI00089ACEB2|nr:ABC transporter permease subunit [Oribacterium sp. KHPX15]SEA62652.1 putative aldouronate transport system permease protein [Oribacterium sp. KHPX15]
MAFKRYRLVPGKSFFYSLFHGSDWVGLSNFRFLMINPQMMRVVRNTLLYNLVFLILGIIVPVTLAIILSYIHSGFVRSVTQICMLLPHFMSWVIVSYFVYAFLSADRGIINNVLEKLGRPSSNFYLKPEIWPFVLVIVHIWKTSGYSMLIYYANICGIDSDLYDCAAIDGASVGQVIRYVILPQLRNMVVVLLLLNLGHILSTDFGLFYQVTRNAGSLLATTETIDVFVYKALIEQTNYGFSAAASLIQNGIGCILLILASRIVAFIDPEGGII